MPIFARRRPSAAPVERDEGGDVGSVRKLPTSPIYPRGGEDELSESKEPGSREKMTRLLRGGRFCTVSEMLGVFSPSECAEAIGELCDSGYVVECIGGRLVRLRVRGEAEPRQSLADVLVKLELEVVAERNRPLKTREVSKSSEGRLTELSGGELVLSDPPSDMTLSLDGWCGFTRAVLAKRGSGKTYFAGVMVEEVMGRDGHPMVVVVDPGGVWWGLLALAGGTPSAYQILLLGGSRGHLPLKAEDGSAAAEVVSRVRPVTVVLDLSRLSPAEQHRLVADFCERLWDLEQFPVHLVVDEADEFAPQRFGALPKQQRRSLDFLSRVVMRGRARGMGVTLISLRPAVLAKNLLSQVDELYLLRLVESNDLRAVTTWLENFQNHVTTEQRAKCLSNLPMLGTGIAYFLRGGDRPDFRRFKVRQKRTFDSSRTMKSSARLSAVLSRPSSELLSQVKQILDQPRSAGEED